MRDDQPAGEHLRLRLAIVEGDGARDLARLTRACLAIFSDFDPDYLAGRLATVTDPSLACAWDGDEIAAFKLGYRRGLGLFYSWLGGVCPHVRRQGLARRLMDMQHRWASEAGYDVIETRTRATNGAMISLNLRNGFVISGFEIDPRGIGVVTQRKRL